MPPFEHMDGRFMDHPWWGFFGWFAPLLIVAMLVGLAVWVITRSTRQPPVAAAAQDAGWAPPRPQPDPALEHARMRYAQGELGRDEFLRLSGDLGGPAAVVGAASGEVPKEEATPDA